MTLPRDLYSEYLRLDRLLTAQTPWSGQGGKPAHDEMLFIIFHQTYELWFRQISFELDDVQARFSGHVVDDRDVQPIVARLDRIAAIWRLLVRQLDVLETMAPQDFLDFRESLKTASGFQSWQFRMIEARLGLRRDDRIPVFHGQFDDALDADHKQQIARAESAPSVYDQIDGWLARTPFVDWCNYRFWESYRAAVDQMLDAKAAAARQNLSGAALGAELEAIDRGRRKFHLIFDEREHAKGVEEGLWR